MKFGTIGAENVALAFARSAIACGHEVVLSSRGGPIALWAKVVELGKGASAAPVAEVARLDYVLLAVPWKNVWEVLSGLPDWHGRVLIDATNAITQVSPKTALAALDGTG
jgi:predicted dinucleotide-binding enzyme